MFLVLFSITTFRVWFTRLHRFNITLKVSVNGERNLFRSVIVFKLEHRSFFGTSILMALCSLQYSLCLFKDSRDQKGFTHLKQKSRSPLRLDTCDANKRLDSNVLLHLLLTRELYYDPYPYWHYF